MTIDPYNLIFVDMVLKGQKIVFEINGPYHYLMNDHSKQINNDILNQKIVESFGYTIKTINIDNFNKMEREDKDRVFENLYDIIN